MRTSTALAVLPGARDLARTSIERRELRDDDVALDVLFCGVCSSDLHAISQAAGREHALVPGHELTGRVSATGRAVTSVAPGDLVAVGNIIDSCGACEECRAGLENFCRAFPTPTYGGVDRHDGLPSYGGFATELVAPQRFVHPLPASLDPAAAAPLLCAGVTVWEPLRHYRAGPGTALGVVGLGGLGHLAVKFGIALGAQVTVFTTSPSKQRDAISLGADDVVVSTDLEQMRGRARTLDLIVDTGSGSHDPSPYLETLRIDGTLCMLGIADRIDVSSFSLRWGRHRLTGSGTGSVRSTREMLRFAAAHDVVADVELLPAASHREALRRLAANDVRWRFVLDLRSLSADG